MAGFTTRPVIQGTRGVIASGHYISAAIGMHILETGGNAIDAGVAAGFALNLTKPQSTGIGGEAPILIYRAGDGHGPQIAAINGQGSAPGRATIDWFREARVDVIPGDGFLPITIPAAFGAWVTALLLLRHADPQGDARPGPSRRPATASPSTPRSSAGDRAPGRAVPRGVAVHRRDLPRSRRQRPDDRQDPASSRTGRRRCRAPSTPRCARPIAAARPALRAALDYWYRGPVAEKAVDFSSTTEVHDASGRPHRGLLDADDFAELPHQGRGPGHARTTAGIDVYKCGPWTQGPVFLQQLMLLEGFDLAKMGHNSPSTSTPSSRRPSWRSPTASSTTATRPSSTCRSTGCSRRSTRRSAAKLIDPNEASAELRPGDAAADPAEGRSSATRASTPATRPTSTSSTPSRQHVRGHAERRLDPVLAGRPRARLPARDARPAVLPRPGPPGLARARQAPAHDPDAVAGDEGRPAAHGLRHAGRRPAGPVDAPVLPQRRRLRDGPAGGDRRGRRSTRQHFPSSFYPHGAHPKRVVVEGRLPAATRDALAAARPRHPGDRTTGRTARSAPCASTRTPA